jgi:hypothetical protein
MAQIEARSAMTRDETSGDEALRHADLSARSPTDLTQAERAELNRRYEIFMRHFRAANVASAPAAGKARRIRKWHP